jgi:Na+/H+-translocating membrane pyrophosphatase
VWAVAFSDGLVLFMRMQLAISMSNTGGAWDNAKKYVESGQLKFTVNGEEVVQRKGRCVEAPRCA